MTDNRTTELRRLLDDRGVEYEAEDMQTNMQTYWGDWCVMEPLDAKPHTLGAQCELMLIPATPEQAIAATLGSEPPYDELLRCLEHDWNISASWDGLRKFWCIELTEEGVKLRDAIHGMLTAEQVREAIMLADRWEKPMGDTGLTNTHLIIRDDGWQAIADELNAKLGSGTCEMVTSGTACKGNTDKRCTSCGAYGIGEHYDGDEHITTPKFCPECGAKVVKR